LYGGLAFNLDVDGGCTDYLVYFISLMTLAVYIAKLDRIPPAKGLSCAAILTEFFGGTYMFLRFFLLEGRKI